MLYSSLKPAEVRNIARELPYETTNTSVTKEKKDVDFCVCCEIMRLRSMFVFLVFLDRSEDVSVNETVKMKRA